jgi:hypothetical protein
MEYTESNKMSTLVLTKARIEERQGRSLENKEIGKSLIKARKRDSPEKDFSEAIQQIYLELTGKKGKIEEHLAIPIAPDLATQKRSTIRKEQHKTTEEIEAEEVEKERYEMRKRLKENAKYYKRALDGCALEIKSNKSPTTHNEITLRTEERYKIHQQYMQKKEQRLKVLKELELEEQKKQITLPKTPTKPLTITTPQPFTFVSERRIHRVSEEAKEFISLQQQMTGFYTQRSVLKADSTNERKTTYPKSPDFELSKRLIPHKAKTTEELEIEEIQNYPKFKAQPVNEKILYGKVPIGIPVVEHRPATTFKEFSLSTEYHSQRKVNLVEEKEWKLEVGKLNKSILAEPNFIPQKSSKLPTEPEPFIFNIDKRVNRKSIGSVSSSELKQFKALPIPSYPSQPFAQLPKHKPTETIPFNLHTSRQEINEEKEAPITFKALQMPTFKPPAIHKPNVKTTQVTEYKFATEKRKRSPAITVNEIVSTFKARGMPDYERGRVNVKKSTKPLTKVVGVNLKSEKRSIERAKFDMQQLLITEAELQKKKAKELEEQEKEKLEIKELRKSMVFRAGGIMKGRGIEIKPSTTPLTQPQAPLLTTERRASKPKE